VFLQNKPITHLRYVTSRTILKELVKVTEIRKTNSLVIVALFRVFLFIALSFQCAVAFGQDYYLNALPSPAVISPGGTASLVVSVNSMGGFTGTVNLSLSGLPAGITGSVSPSSLVAPGMAIVSLAASSGAMPGDFNFQVNGNSGGLSHRESAALSIATAPPIRYTYDAVGRLTSVTNQVGQGAIYSYDAVGNLLSISPHSVGQLSVTAFWPTSGLPGTTVAIVGSGFSTTPAQNTVHFNGTPGVVLSCTSTAIITRVPVNASSGPITVTSGGLSGTSINNFNVNSPTWTNTGINGASGSVTYANGVYTVQNQGASLGGTSDGLQFGYTPLVGDGTIVARMTGFGAASNSDAGIMLRTGPTPTAAMVYVGIENWLASMKWRTDTGQAVQVWPPSGTSAPSVATPYWLRLVRTGSTITASISANGVDWTQIGSPQTLNIVPGSTMYAGVMVAGVWGYSPVTATFDNVTVSPAADFYLTAFPTTWTLTAAGQTSSYALGIGALNGFNGTVNVSVTGLPAGANVNVNPPNLWDRERRI
jgi:YD repeat-containing protein